MVSWITVVYVSVYSPPAPSGLCQPVQNLFASEICHVFFTVNIRVNRIAEWMERNI
jgi:hypothetical protein